MYKKLLFIVIILCGVTLFITGCNNKTTTIKNGVWNVVDDDVITKFTFSENSI